MRLESCPSIAEALRDDSGQAEDGADASDALGEALLWGAGCAGLGGADRRLRRLQDALESATPLQVLESAREAVERECGAEANGADADDLNWDWALRRIAARARKASDIGSTVLAQVWQELLRVHLSAAGTDDRGHLPAENREAEEDASMIFWLKHSEEEARQAARVMSQERLAKEVEKVMDCAARAMLLGGRLRELVEGWSRFDAYRVLGVRRGASRSEVRRAFYRKALVLHPDKGGDKVAFQELQRAYDEVLRHLDGDGGDEPCGPDAEEQDDGSAAEARRSSTGGEDGSFFKAPHDSAAADGKDAERAAREDEEDASRAGAWSCRGEEASGVGGLDLSEEERKRLASLSRAASTAADCAREVADRALRCASAARMALEEEPVAWDEAHAQTEAALVATRELTEAARKVTRHTAKAAGILSRCNDANGSVDADCSIDGAAVVSVAVELSTMVCLRAVAEASVALRRSVAEYFGEEDPEEEEEECADETGDFVARLDGAITTLAEAVRHLSVAAVDAAETIAEAVSAVGISLNGGDTSEEDDGEDRAACEDEEEQDEGPEEDGGSSSSSSSSESGAEPGRKTAEEEEEERSLRRVLEARQQLSALLEAVRMLKRANAELLRLQRTARQTADSQADQAQRRAAEERCRERALVLLAEFLDQAAIGVQGGLREVLGASSEPGAQGTRDEDLGSFVRSAIEESFGFVTSCSPELAMPQDPRTQALRAAMVFDPEAVRNMLGPQVSQRLQSGLMSAMLDAACDAGTGPDGDSLQGPPLLHGKGGAALDGLQAELLGAHERLAASLAAGGA